MRPTPRLVTLLSRRFRAVSLSDRPLTSFRQVPASSRGVSVRFVRSRRRFSTQPDVQPEVLAPSPSPVSLTEGELLRLLLRNQRVWFWLGGAVFIGATLVAFGPELKVGVSKHTAEVATKSLQDETLQRNTRELASQIVQTVLNDPNVLDQASQFIQRLVVTDSTRDALRGLVVNTLNDPVTLSHVAQLTKTTLSQLLNDPSTRVMVVQFLQQTLQDQQTREALLKLLDAIMNDQSVQQNLSQLLAKTFVQDPVKQSVTQTMTGSVHEVLSRRDIQNHAKEFVGSVVQDQTVQAQSGDAIWGTVMYAITPSWLSWIWQSSEEEEQAAPAAAAAMGGATPAPVVPSPPEISIAADAAEVITHAAEEETKATTVEEIDQGDEDEDEEEEQLSHFERLRRRVTFRPVDKPKKRERRARSPSPEPIREPLASETPTPPSSKPAGYAQSLEDRHLHGAGSGFA